MYNPELSGCSSANDLTVYLLSSGFGSSWTIPNELPAGIEVLLLLYNSCLSQVDRNIQSGCGYACGLNNKSPVVIVSKLVLHDVFF